MQLHRMRGKCMPAIETGDSQPSATPQAACSGMRLSPRVAHELAAHPREGAEVCARWKRALQS